MIFIHSFVYAFHQPTLLVSFLSFVYNLLSKPFIYYILCLGVLSGCFVWVFCLGVLSGCFVWVFCLGVLSGCFVWAFCLGVLSGRFVWAFCLGVLSGRFVWAFCLGVLSGRFVWAFCLGVFILVRCCLQAINVMGVIIKSGQVLSVSLTHPGDNVVSARKVFPENLQLSRGLKLITLLQLLFKISASLSNNDPLLAIDSYSLSSRILSLASKYLLAYHIMSTFG